MLQDFKDRRLFDNRPTTINKIFCPRCRGKLVYTNQSQDRRELRQFYGASCGSTTTVNYWRGSEPEIATIKTIIEHKREAEANKATEII